MSNNDANDKCELSFESWCKTKDGEEFQFNFVWPIKNFSARPEKTGKSLCSSIFKIQAPDEIKSDWKIELYPKGTDPEYSNFISVFACKEGEKESEEEFLAKTKFSVLDVDQKRHYQENGNDRDEWDNYNESDFGDDEVFNLDILHSKASLLLPNDCLTILCEVTILIPDKSAPVSVDGDCKMVQTSQENLIKDLELAFSHKEFTDVQIKCGDKVFDCHQFMLCARSPVFRAMFQAEMEEKKTKKVIVSDIHPDVLEEMLTFIYTGKCSNVDNMARDLLGAADKYQVEILKTICIEKLCNSIDVGTCVDYLIVGDMHQADLLKKRSLDFIAKNVGRICDQGDWKDSLLGHPSLMADVIEAMGRKDFWGKVTHGSCRVDYR